MIILGKHKQSLDLIRSLAITSHALDLSAEHLFVSGTYNNKGPFVKEIYDGLLSTHLLQLAVAIRTNIYQGLLEGDSEKFVTHCGFLDIEDGEKERTVPFSIKDVCDKIIHADKISRELSDESVGSGRSVTVILGSRGKEKWKMSISIELFCEAVLNWLDDVDET
jgi:hypothetical protein